jgi:hypothetical protein
MNDAESHDLQAGAWELEAGAPFEALMDKISEEINAQIGHVSVQYILTSLSYHDKEVGLKVDSSGAMVARGEDSESRQLYVAVKHMLRELIDLFKYIPLDTKYFKGRAYRYRTVVQCGLIHIGLYHLEKLLVGRRDWRQKLVEAGRHGKSLYMLEPPRWKYFHLEPVSQTNIYCYDRVDYARLEKIHEEYGWDLGYTVQAAIIVGMTHSEKLPKEWRELAEKEMEEIKAWVKEFNNIY